VEFTFDHHHQHVDFIRMVMIENIHHGKYLDRSKVIRNLNVTAIDKIKAIYAGLADGVFLAPISTRLNCTGRSAHSASSTSPTGDILEDFRPRFRRAQGPGVVAPECRRYGAASGHAGGQAAERLNRLPVVLAIPVYGLCISAGCRHQIIRRCCMSSGLQDRNHADMVSSDWRVSASTPGAFDQALPAAMRASVSQAAQTAGAGISQDQWTSGRRLRQLCMAFQCVRDVRYQQQLSVQWDLSEAIGRDRQVPLPVRLKFRSATTQMLGSR
jgi:hypothetical protein